MALPYPPRSQGAVQEIAKTGGVGVNRSDALDEVLVLGRLMGCCSACAPSQAAENESCELWTSASGFRRGLGASGCQILARLARRRPKVPE